MILLVILGEKIKVILIGIEVLVKALMILRLFLFVGILIIILGWFNVLNNCLVLLMFLVVLFFKKGLIFRLM